MKEKENNTLVRPLQYNFMASIFIYKRTFYWAYLPISCGLELVYIFR